MSASDSPTELTTQIFKIFEEIRSALVERGGIDDLPLDFPIVEMDASDDAMANFLGMCHYSTRFETAADVKRKNFEMSVDRISMRVLCKDAAKDDGKGQQESHYHLLRLIPTLLHEFAHATTEIGRCLDMASEDSCRNRKLKRMEHYSHDDLFYDHFRRILKAADALGIYSLPNSSNKYNYPALRRFDQVDLEVCPLSLCGSSKIYSAPLQRQSNAETDEMAIFTPTALQALNLTVINGKGVRKFVQVKDNRFETLKMDIGKKFGSKGWSKIQTQKGEQISEETLPMLVKSGDTIHIM